MNFEEDIFACCHLIEQKLIPYGFTKKNNTYYISKTVLNNSFRFDIEITPSSIKGKVYDLSFNEEYTNYRNPNVTGEFVGRIREEYTAFLKDICANCYQKDCHLNEDVSEWVIPANPAYYNIFGAFANSDILYWHQSNNIEVGDIIYIYVTNPYRAIMFKCEVLETNLPASFEDTKFETKKRQMKLQLIAQYDKDTYNYLTLEKHGLTSIRGPRHIPESLSLELNKITK